MTVMRNFIRVPFGDLTMIVGGDRPFTSAECSTLGQIAALVEGGSTAPAVDGPVLFEETPQ